MNLSTNKTEDRMMSKDHMDLPSVDEGSCGKNSVAGLVLKKGPWTPAEDAILVDYVKRHGEGNWNAMQKNSGLFRCGKSCRLRWANHLRPNLKKGSFTADEERLIIELHARMGNKWARMAAHLPGRTDNEIKNYWNTRIKRCQRAGLPLYPPDLYLQALNENQKKRKPCCEIQGLIFDKANPGAVSHASILPQISIASILTQDPVSFQKNSLIPPVMHFSKRLKESENLYTGFTGSNAIAMAARPSRHALLNDNSSASKPITRDLKLELPSLQYPETDLGSWCMQPLPPSLDAFVQYPDKGEG